MVYNIYIYVGQLVTTWNVYLIGILLLVWAIGHKNGQENEV